jgi:hypothetical protein
VGASSLNISQFYGPLLIVTGTAVPSFLPFTSPKKACNGVPQIRVKSIHATAFSKPHLREKKRLWNSGKGFTVHTFIIKAVTYKLTLKSSTFLIKHTHQGKRYTNKRKSRII